MSKKSILILGLDFFFSFSVLYRKRRMSGDDAYKFSICITLFNTQQKKHQLKKTKGLKFWLMLKIGGVFLESQNGLEWKGP